MNEKKPPFLFFLIMFIAMVIFSYSWVSGKRLSGITGPGILTFFRFATTTLFLLPIVLGKRQNLYAKYPHFWIWTFVAAAMLSLYNRFFFLGLDAGLAGKGAVIVSALNPLFTYMIIIAIRKNTTSVEIFSLALGFLGGVLLIEPWNQNFLALTDSKNWVFPVAALFWSLFTLASRKSQNFGKDPWIFNFWLHLMATVLTLPFLISTKNSQLPEGNVVLWFDFLFLGIMVNGVGMSLYFNGFKKLGLIQANAFIFLVPALAIVFTRIFLGEQPSLMIIFGATLTILAVIFMNFSTKKAEELTVEEKNLIQHNET